MTLEERISRLEDIEEIRNLQGKYQRCLDNRDFDELANCFTVDAASSYGNNTMSYQGRDNIIKFLASVMDIKMVSTHLIHAGEINWIDTNNAEATWYLEDYLLHKAYLLKIHGAANYHVTYRKIDGKWFISSIGYERTYEYVEHRGPLNIATLHKTTLLDKIKKADPNTLGEYGRFYKNKKKRK